MSFIRLVSLAVTLNIIDNAPVTCNTPVTLKQSWAMSSMQKLHKTFCSTLKGAWCTTQYSQAKKKEMSLLIKLSVVYLKVEPVPFFVIVCFLRCAHLSMF